MTDAITLQKKIATDLYNLWSDLRIKTGKNSIVFMLDGTWESFLLGNQLSSFMDRSNLYGVFPTVYLSYIHSLKGFQKAQEAPKDYTESLIRKDALECGIRCTIKPLTNYTKEIQFDFGQECFDNHEVADALWAIRAMHTAALHRLAHAKNALVFSYEFQDSYYLWHEELPSHLDLYRGIQPYASIRSLDGYALFKSLNIPDEIKTMYDKDLDEYKNAADIPMKKWNTANPFDTNLLLAYEIGILRESLGIYKE